jgi:formamidopyrimidine-DNA glycosylase
LPELPEVEHIRRWLQPQLAGKTIAGILVEPGSERCAPQGQDALSARLVGRKVEAVKRRSKVILLPFGDETLAIHLKMTGQLWVDRAPKRAHTRVALRFSNGNFLSLVDMRKFGWLQLWKAGEFAAWERKQGPEPVPQLPAGWETTLKSRRSIKAVLLDQAVVAGIGNIYADEILFRARLAPTRSAASLTGSERQTLRQSVESEMQAAVDERAGEPDQKRVGGGDRSVKALFDWKVFQHDNEPCRECGTPISRTVVAGRGTYSCRRCQR